MNDLGIYGGWLTVNRFCNFRCGWCYAIGSAFKPEDNMPLDMAKKLIDLMHAVGIKSAVLIGGETLFWPHLFSIATYLKSLGMESTAVTNGWLLGFEKFRRKVNESDITALAISLKAGNRQQYIDLTRFDGYDKVLEGLRETRSWEHIRIETSVVINTRVIRNIDEVVKVAFENGAKSINISLCGPIISGKLFDSQYMPDPQEIVSTVVSKYPIIDGESGGQFSIEESLPACLWPPEFLAALEAKNQVSFGCHFKTRSGLLFDRRGNVLACNHLFDYPLGQFGVDFNDLDSFSVFWNKPEIDAFYDKMLEYPARACIQCRSFDKCGGGCPLYWLVREPDSVIPLGGEYERKFA
jgi:radical SAM protein with 4Fe4S-binding SPASM domain